MDMANIIGAKKITYSIVGRYMHGSAVSAYHIIGSDGKEFKASRELVCFLVGKGLVTNCKGQMNDGDIVLRGVGINLTELPVLNERTGKVSNVDNVKAQDINDKKIFIQFKITARLFQDGKCVGYVVRDAGGTEKKLERSVVLKLASDKKISNARINMVNGVPILRGVGEELDKLPVIQLPSSNKAVKVAVNEQVTKQPIKTLKVFWYEIESTLERLEKHFQKDNNNNASGIYQYPVLELMNAHAATMAVLTDKGVFKITQVRKGINTNNRDYGLEFILRSLKDKVRVVCEDISVLAFNIHVLGFMAITALLKIDGEISVQEFMFENKVDKLLWREYCTVKNSNKFNLTNKAIEITVEDTNNLTSKYDVSLSPLSNLGIKRRYPTISMVANNNAIMCVNTSNGYYEVGRVKYGFNNGIGLALELIDKLTREKHVIAASKMDKASITTKNISILCAAALAKINPQIVIYDVLLENKIEDAIIGYNFNKN